MTAFEVTGFRYDQRLDSNNLCIYVLNIQFFFSVRTAIKTRGYIKANNGLTKLRTKQNITYLFDISYLQNR